MNLMYYEARTTQALHVLYCLVLLSYTYVTCWTDNWDGCSKKKIFTSTLLGMMPDTCI